MLPAAPLARFVAVEAFPDKAPVKVVADKLFVEGLKLSPVPKLKAWLLFVEIKGKMWRS